MAPRPLIQVNKRAVIWGIGQQALLRAPDVAAQAMRCIAQWSLVELSLSGVLVELLGANARPAMAMVSASTSSQAQVAALEAAAVTVLSIERGKVFKAALQLIRNTGKHRNRLAHWIWAFSDDVPDCLLLMDPEHYTLAAISVAEAKLDPKASVEFRYPKEFIWVYAISDLIEYREKVLHVNYLINWLRLLGSPDLSRASQAHDQLCREPEIQKILDRQNRKPTSPPAPPP